MIEIELIYFELFVVFSVIFDLIFLVITRSAWLIELNFKTIFHYIGNLNNSVRFRVDSVLNFVVYLSSIYHVFFFLICRYFHFIKCRFSLGVASCF